MIAARVIPFYYRRWSDNTIGRAKSGTDAGNFNIGAISTLGEKIVSSFA
jgi:hypothetical protein